MSSLTESETVNVESFDNRSFDNRKDVLSEICEWRALVHGE